MTQYTKKSASLDVWHRHLGHVGVTSIVEMAKKGVINGLDIMGDVEVQGKCEDCIYGKQTARPYDEVTEHEKMYLSEYTLTFGVQRKSVLPGVPNT